MIHEFRTYTCNPGKLPDEIERLRKAATVFFPRHGIKVLGYWSVLVGPDSGQLHYIIEWESMAEQEEKWGAFLADPEWIAAKADSEKDGPLLARVTNSLLKPLTFD
ncbi:NIPSNAP family protein [Pseudonocardia halophobica]|uniref:NIPSNAP family protein n=1 Tax=Pseudonocardia halophobica TaxID=29401 RepID=A0A9W6P0Y6_9PSEU|nr:NIPSNAP family protein [Pseudonocardia halophobica]GLL15843.1 NIPSNAP family protein [Pseudonocardia halophobica]